METEKPVENIRSLFTEGSVGPAPELVRGKCPQCGGDLVSNYYYGRRGYIIVWECWSSLNDRPTCDYRKVI